MLFSEYDQLMERLSGLFIITKCVEGQSLIVNIIRWLIIIVANGLRDLGDQMKTKLGEGVVLLISENDGKVNMVAMATDGAVKMGAHSGNIIKALAPLVEGGGGGKPAMAQAGGKNPAGIDKAIAEAQSVLEGMIK